MIRVSEILWERGEWCGGLERDEVRGEWCGKLGGYGRRVVVWETRIREKGVEWEPERGTGRGEGCGKREGCGTMGVWGTTV